MKQFFKKCILFVYLYIQDIIPNGFFLFSNNERIERSFLALKKQANFIKQIGSNKMYSKMLHQLIPGMELKLDKTSFLGKGLGGGSINVFRKIEENQKLLFEKIYFNKDIELKVNIWFYENLYDTLSADLIIPKIWKHFSGKKITALYYEYKELAPLTIMQYQKDSLKILGVLYKITCFNEHNDKLKFYPNYIDSYKRHSFYKKRKSQYKSELDANNIELNNVEIRLEKSKRIISHGDLNQENVYQGFSVIDWDSCGLFPLGFDSAYVYFQLLNKDINIEDFETWLFENFQEIIEKSDWDDFLFNNYAFLLLFLSNNTFKSKNNQLYFWLILKIKMNI